MARSNGVRNGIEVFSEDKLSTILPETDALVMILPGSDSTKDALNSGKLGWLPNHAWVVNVGRGTCIDENALANALNKNEIGGAALDVFETEPLPEDNPLYVYDETYSRSYLSNPWYRRWKAKNLILSPHAAGGRPQGAEELITRNLRRFLAGQELDNRI